MQHLAARLIMSGQQEAGERGDRQTSGTKQLSIWLIGMLAGGRTSKRPSSEAFVAGGLLANIWPRTSREIGGTGGQAEPSCSAFG